MKEGNTSRWNFGTDMQQKKQRAHEADHTITTSRGRAPSFGKEGEIPLMDAMLGGAYQGVLRLAVCTS